MPGLAAAFPAAPPAGSGAAPSPGLRGGRRGIRLPAILRPVPKPPRRMAEAYGAGGSEPALEDLLGDPLVLLVLARDGLTVAEVRDQMHAARRRLLTAATA